MERTEESSFITRDKALLCLMISSFPYCGNCSFGIEKTGEKKRRERSWGAI